MLFLPLDTSFVLFFSCKLPVHMQAKGRALSFQIQGYVCLMTLVFRGKHLHKEQKWLVSISISHTIAHVGISPAIVPPAVI